VNTASLLLVRLFLIPQYCGTLLEQSLLLNRRRNHFEELPNAKRSVSGAIKADHNTIGVDDSASVSESEKLRIHEGVHTRIYVCATMWHETANEMVQVLKSIMRYALSESRSIFVSFECNSTSILIDVYSLIVHQWK
jgi:chitin synthase